MDPFYQLSYEGSPKEMEAINSVCVCVSHSVVSDAVTPQTAAHQAPLSMEFSRQEYWSGLPFPSPGDIPDPGIKPGSSGLQADSLLSELLGKPEVSVNILLILTLHRKQGKEREGKRKVREKV